MQRRNTGVRAFITLICLAAFSAGLDAVLAQPETNIRLRSDGVVVVEARLFVLTGLNEYPAPVEPIPATIETYIDSVQIPSIYVNGTIYVPSPVNGTLLIRYVANVTRHGNVFSFLVNSNGTIVLMVEPKIVLLSIPTTIVDVRTRNGVMEIVFVGRAAINYTLTVKPVSPAKTGKSAESRGSQGGVGETAEKALKEENVQQLSVNNYLLQVLATAVVFAAAALVYRAYLRRRQRYVSGLDEVDLSILEEVKKSGGTMLQGDLLKRLSIPKATLWRHVRRLEKMGYLDVVKEGKANRIILRKRL